MLTQTTVKPIYSISISIQFFINFQIYWGNARYAHFIIYYSISNEEVHETLVSLDVQKSPGIDLKTVWMLYVGLSTICLPNHRFKLTFMLESS